MKIVLKDINGNVRISGDYESIVDCMVQNKSNLSYIDFSNIDFRNEDFSGANLKYVYIKGSDFSNANFSGVDFRNVDLSCISLDEDNLFGVDFGGVKFCGARFYGANFEGSNFSNVIFSGGDFSNGNFKAANLVGINFTNVDLRGVGITCYFLYDVLCINTYLDHTLLKIQGSHHLFCGYGGMVRIGCEYHTVDDWLYHGAYTDEYSKSERDEYMEYLKMYSKIWEGER
jgi:hypothetical protein